MLNNNVINHIKSFEGLSLKPYQDQAGVWTIGYGNTYYENGKKVSSKDAPITRERANLLFTTIVNQFAKGVKGLIISSVNSNQLGALVSLTYNIGLGAFKQSTVLKRVNENPNDPSIGEAIARFKNVKGVPNKGLINRRASEWVLYKSNPVIDNLIIPVLLFFFTVFTISL